MRRWSPGDPVLWRSVDDGETATVLPMTVVRDDGAMRALCLRPGTVYKRRTGERGGPTGRMMLRWDGGHEDATWRTNRALILNEEGDPHSVWLFWNDATAEFLGWYINLEDPWRRTRLGFDTRDRVLDLVVAPDLAAWRWKDEDELEWSVERGRYTREDAGAMRRDGLRALDALRSRRERHAAWLAWRPDPSWAIPTVGEAWRQRA